MAKYPKYLRCKNKTNNFRCIAILSATRAVVAESHNGKSTLKNILNIHDVSRMYKSKSYREIGGEEFYSRYLLVRRRLNKQCINLIKSLNQKEQTQ